MKSSKRNFLRAPSMIKEENAMRVKARPTRIELGNQVLRAEMTAPVQPAGWVLVPRFANERKTARIDSTTLRGLNALGFATLVVNLPQRDAPTRATAEWLRGAIQWLYAQAEVGALPVGILSAGQTTAPALMVAANLSEVAYLLSWNGDPAQAWQHLHRIYTPTLLMTSANSSAQVWWSNWVARWFLNNHSEFSVIPDNQPRLAHLAEWYNRRVVSEPVANKVERSTPLWAQRGLTTAMLLGLLAAPTALGATPALAASTSANEPTSRQITAIVSNSNSSEFSDSVSIAATQVKGDGVGATQPLAHVDQFSNGLGDEFSDSVIVDTSKVYGDGLLPPKQDSGPTKTKRNGRRNPKATGSKAYVDGHKLKYFINTNITFSTSSSASGAMSEGSFTAAVPASTKNGGTVNSVLTDAFDGYNTICISVNNTVAPCNTSNPNFQIYNKNGAPTAVDPVTQQVVFPVKNFGTLAVSRKVFVPKNDNFARWLNIVKNNGNTPQTVTLVVSNNLGSDSNTIVTGTSSGDLNATTADTWVTSFQNWNGTTSSDPRLAHIFQGTGSPRTPLAGIHFVDADDNPYWGWTFTLQPGQTGIIMEFVTGYGKTADAKVKAAQLTNPATYPNSLQYMSDAEKSQVLNYGGQAAAPEQPKEVPEADTILLISGGMASMGVWLQYEWNKRRARK